MLAHHPNRLAEIEGSKHTASRVKRCDENKQMKSISSRDDTQRRTKRTLRSTLLPARSQVAAVARHLPGASSPGEQRLCQDGTWIDVERPRRAPPSRSAPCGPRGKPKQAVREQACAGVTSRRDHVNRLLCKQRAREDAEAALARHGKAPRRPASALPRRRPPLPSRHPGGRGPPREPLARARSPDELRGSGHLPLRYQQVSFTLARRRGCRGRGSRRNVSNSHVPSGKSAKPANMLAPHGLGPHASDFPLPLSH